ncbi:MAG: ZIP family metal transporter [Acidobacteria bacterium]|nr:MAG: ZIP family metal transporter [Acidobacteriota bacterium]
MDSVVFIASLLLLGTFLGSILAVFFRRLLFSVGVSLSFTGGVMLVASFTSLILPGVEVGGFFQVALGITLGFAFMAFLENLIPHEHMLKGREGISSERLSRIYLIVLGVVIHNVPEGLSVGIASAYSLDKGLETSIAIALQDAPEGLVVSLPLMVLTGKVLIPLFMGFLSGLLEFFFALGGYIFFELFKNLLAFGLGFGGGAMVYVTAKEVFPEAYAEGKHTLSTLAFLLGLLLMLFLDTSL